MFRLRASNFLCRQKVTKELSKGRGISISLSPLKSPLLETTNQGGLRPPYWMYPPGVGNALKEPAANRRSNRRNLQPGAARERGTTYGTFSPIPPTSQ